MWIFLLLKVLSKVPFYPCLLYVSLDFKTPLAHMPVNVTFSPDSDNGLGLFAFSTPAPIVITILCEITAPARWIPIITSLIFQITPSLTLLDLPTLTNWLYLDPKSFLIFFFQLVTVLLLNSYCGYFELKRLSSSLCNVT